MNTSEYDATLLLNYLSSLKTTSKQERPFRELWCIFSECMSEAVMLSVFSVVVFSARGSRNKKDHLVSTWVTTFSFSRLWLSNCSCSLTPSDKIPPPPGVVAISFSEFYVIWLFWCSLNEGSHRCLVQAYQFSDSTFKLDHLEMESLVCTQRVSDLENLRWTTTCHNVLTQESQWCHFWCMQPHTGDTASSIIKA